MKKMKKMKKMIKYCKERIPDNGDDYSCDKPLPCPRHPPELIEAHESLNKIEKILYPVFGSRTGSYQDIMKLIANVVDQWRKK